MHGWHKSGRPLTARASLSDKFSPLWLAVRTIVGNEAEHHSSGTTTVDWQCTEHGRRWSDPLRWTPGVLLHRVADTAANVATSSGRQSEGRFVSLFNIPPCSPPLLVELAGSTFLAPAKVIRTALDTHGPSRLLRLLDQSITPLKSARGVKFTADGLAHLEATELLHTKTPSHIVDAGLRDALGRYACTLQNLVSVESPTVSDRIHLILTGSTARSPLQCILCQARVVDDNKHVRSCSATAQHRSLRFLRMAEVLASLGDTMHHDPSLRPSVRARHCSEVRDLLSGIHVTPFHERTPIRTMSQDAILLPSQDIARRYGVWEDAPGRKRTLRAVLLADRAHIVASLALHFALDIDVSHVFATTVSTQLLFWTRSCFGPFFKTPVYHTQQQIPFTNICA